MHIRTLRLEGQTAKEMDAELRALAVTPPASLALCFGHRQAINTLSQQTELEHIAKHWLAGSSCQGYADQTGIDNTDRQSATLMLINDATGYYGVGSAVLDKDIRQQTKQALQQAMHKAGKAHELPTLIWCLQAPGTEEIVLEAIQELVGNEVPIFGGSTADDDISGKWLQFDGSRLFSNAIVVAVFYPSTPISSYFSSGYVSTLYHGRVTAAENRRLYSIDHQPAASVYNSWLQQAGVASLVPGNILRESTLFPFGREINRHNSLPLYLLSHPATMHEDGSLSLFSDVRNGEQLWLMQGDKAHLVARAGEVVRTARQNLKFQYNCDAAAAIIVYCAGCMLAVKDNLAEVQQAIRAELGDLPFIVTFTFGEQGCFIDGSNRHGNLMISAVLIGTSHAQ